MCKKLARLLDLLRRICFYLITESMVLFYNSYVMPCFTYCTNVWANCNKTDLNRLFMYQKGLLGLFLMIIQQRLMICFIGPSG